MKEYVYQVRDHSILLPAFKKFFLLPLSSWISLRIPANIITIFSNGFFYATIGVSSALEQLPTLRFACLAILIFIYLTGDHLDGLQAKRTGTSSPLGEFIDHYLDSYINVIYLLVMFSVFGINNLYLLSFTLFVSYSAHASVFYEQFRTGWIVFEKLGPFEAFSLIIILFLICCIPGVSTFMESQLTFGLSMAEVMLLTMCIATFYTLAKAQLRTGKSGFGLFIFIILLALVTLAGLSIPFSATLRPWIIALYSIHYVGMLIKSRLIDDKYRMPDLIVPAFLLLCLLFPSIDLVRTDLIAFVYLAARCLISAIHTVFLLRGHWVWVNPTGDSFSYKERAGVRS